MLQTSQPSRW